MVNANISYEDTIDPAGCNCGPEGYQLCSRDPGFNQLTKFISRIFKDSSKMCHKFSERTPMQWSVDKNAGFSTADSTWLPVNPNYIELNVENQNSAEESHLKLYKEFSKFRSSNDVLKYGRLGLQRYENILFISRKMIGREDLCLIVNFGSTTTVQTKNLLKHDEGILIIYRSTNSTNPLTVPG